MTLEAARRHSQRVRSMRGGLIVLAAALVGVLIWQFANQGPGIDIIDNPEESVKMIHPRYSGRTDDGLPFYLTAEEAVRTIANANTVTLDRPVLHFFREAGAPESVIVATSGTYDDVEKILNLHTKVDMDTDDGTKCITTHARIYARTKTVEGDEPISCTGNFGIVNGNAFEIIDNYKTFIFKNQMDAVLEQGESIVPQIGGDDTP